ncbi:hypothetical protein [Oceanobacillus sp. CFH 90083]|uniref:hypothetical protein n=1 Tax=Oceanobacillus sp. CFH 90083 TaxID=2592336 RepID=UPI00128C31F7|nr:hypothetical protein [Oceanobacillus sp. CFH 90083]
MKPIKFTEKKAEKEGKVTPHYIAHELLDAIEQGDVKQIVCITRNSNDEIIISYSDMLQTASVGLLECGKQLIMNDMFDL